MKNFTHKLYLLAVLFISATAYSQTPKLNSWPSAAASVFLDFDGHTVQCVAWQSGNTFICAPSGLTNTQITEIFNRVSEDYRPFNVNVTTDSAKFLASPVTARVRIIITTTSAWYPNVGGISYISTFSTGNDIPAFVFPDRLNTSAKNISEACTHESGHALGLSHQAKYDGNCTLTEAYSTGTGLGQTGWAPVMGNSYGKNMTGWSNGPTPFDCAEPQDNLTIITSENGFTYRSDDYNHSLDNNTATLNSSGFNMQAVISTTTDKDAFKFVLAQAGTMHIEATPFNLGVDNNGANLDIKVMMYNGSKNLIRTYDPAAALNVAIDTLLPADTYYISISGTGNNNTSNYGSLGSYTLSGSKTTLPLHDVSLRGTSEKNIHRLSWSIIADEAIAAQLMEISYNGIDFSARASFGGAVNSYTNTPEKSGKIYYRLKVTSVINQSLYSNVVALKSGVEVKAFTVSTLVKEDITVQAVENFNYILMDMNGRTIAAGKETKGTSRVNTGNLPKGMYIIQLISDNNKQTERIIKQ